MFCSVLCLSLCAPMASFAPDFGPPVFYGGYVSSIVVADFNRDGIQDFAGSDGVVIKTMLGIGDGSFQPPIATFVGDQETFDPLAVGDLNNDGIPDLVTTAGDSRVLRVYLGAGDGTFRAASDIDSHPDVRHITVGDLNGDQASDLVVTSAVWVGEGWILGVSVSLNDGRGGFTITQYWDWDFQFGVNGYPGQALIADFDRDGVNDLAIQQRTAIDGIPTGFGIQYFLGDGDGTFRPSDSRSYEYPGSYDLGSGYFPEELYFSGDYNNDGASDVAAGSTLFIGGGDGTFQPGATLATGEATADFDGDGNLDIVGMSYGSPHIIVNLGLGNGSFGPSRTISNIGYPQSIKTADFNGDGRADVVVDAGGGQAILLNDGNWAGSPPPPVITISNHTTYEGNGGTHNAVIAVTLSTASTLPVTVEYSTSPGPMTPEATPGVDYQETSGVLTFAPGEMWKTISVPVVGDLTVEPIYEYFSVNLSNATNATIGDAEGLCRIDNEEFEPRIFIADDSRTEGNSGNTKLTFQVTLSTASSQAVTISFRTIDGTATTSDRDYAATSGTLTFSPGQTSKTITVQVRGDRKRESNEDFYVALSGPSSNATIGRSGGTGTIVNDD